MTWFFFAAVFLLLVLIVATAWPLRIRLGLKLKSIDWNESFENKSWNEASRRLKSTLITTAAVTVMLFVVMWWVALTVSSGVEATGSTSGYWYILAGTVALFGMLLRASFRIPLSLRAAVLWLGSLVGIQFIYWSTIYYFAGTTQNFGGAPAGGLSLRDAIYVATSSLTSNGIPGPYVARDASAQLLAGIAMLESAVLGAVVLSQVAATVVASVVRSKELAKKQRSKKPAENSEQDQPQ